MAATFRFLLRSLRSAAPTTLALLCASAIALGTAPAARSVTLLPIGSISLSADLVEMHGGYAYMAAGATLSLVDIRDPSTPRFAGAFTFPARIWDFAVSGDLVYVTDDRFELGILDVSNRSAPILRSSLKLPGQPRAIATVGTKAFVANMMSGLEVIDVSNVASPVPLGSYFVEGYARDVAVSGELAYVVDHPTGFYVVDVSKPGAPTIRSAQQSGQSEDPRAPLMVAVSDPSDGAGTQAVRIACVLGGSGALQIYDVSYPAAPVKMATYKTPGRAQRVVIRGSLAYVADGPAGLQIVDLANPARPTIVGSYNTTGPARGVAVNDSLVLVTTGAPDARGVVLRQNSP